MGTDPMDRLSESGQAGSPAGPIPVRQVATDRPWEWLGAGWRDLTAKPAISLAYGIVATACGLLLTLGLGLTGNESLMPVMASGFLLIGPLMAVGLYEKSRRLASGQPVSLLATIDVARRSVGRLAFFVVLLLLVFMIWIRIAFLLLALFLGTNGIPDPREFMPTLLFTQNGLSLLVVGTIVGAAFAAIVFAITVISLPLLMEHRVDSFTAMATSIAAVATNPKPMALWAALIAGFIALGLATIGAGLIVAFPLIGHATWHAYRDITAPR